MGKTNQFLIDDIPAPTPKASPKSSKKKSKHGFKYKKRR